MISPHPQSMPAFAAVMGPVLVKLEKELKGITDGEGIIHKVYSFADDTKAFIKNPEDIRTLNRIVERFEKISGMKMHRDPKKESAKPSLWSTQKFQGMARMGYSQRGSECHRDMVYKQKGQNNRGFEFRKIDGKSETENRRVKGTCWEHPAKNILC